MLAIKGFRVGHGKTQEDVAKAIGVSREWYSQKESGKVPFKSNEIKAFAAFFEKDVSEILHLFF